MESREDHAPPPSEQHRPHPTHYDDWTNELEALGEKLKRETPPEEDWRDYHGSGYSPEETLDRFHNL